MQLFIILLTIGLFLLAAEIFLPGGILGILGGIALLGAVAAGFAAFGLAVGMYIALAVIIGGSASIFIWIKLFPRTRVGQALTLQHTQSSYKAADTDTRRNLVGKTGKAVTDLRPAGIVQIDGRKYSVVSEGMLVQRDSAVQVVKVDGNRIVVRPSDGKIPNALPL
ncbi:MAG: NfeD family protein [Kiritimatiellia bacterium]